MNMNILQASRGLAAVVMLAATASAFADGSVSTSPGAFLALVAPGAYTNTFTGLDANPPAAFSGGGFAYTITALDGTYSNGDFLGTSEPQQALVVTFTGATVTAIGANFYATDAFDAFAAVPISVSLSDGTTRSFTPGSVADSYRGFTSSVGITSLTVGAASAATYVGLDNLTVGVAAVPEPSTMALLAAGCGAIGWVARRRTGRAS